MDNDFITISQCRICNASDLHPLLDYGRLPLANALRSTSDCDQEARYPLTLIYCPQCKNAQIRESVDPSRLFSTYFYQSSQSTTFLEHARALSHRVMEHHRLKASDLIVDIASNDGYLLQYYRDGGLPVLGIEAAENLAALANGRGIPTHLAFFDLQNAQVVKKRHGPATIIHANNVMAHVHGLSDFVAGVAHLLKKGGRFISESPSLLDFLAAGAFDTVYHEHLFIHSLHGLQRLLAPVDLVIERVERLPIHGGSLRFYAGHRGEIKRHKSVDTYLKAEAKILDGTLSAFDPVRKRAHALRDGLAPMLLDLKRKGAKIAAYGAAAKGSTLLSFCGVDDRHLEFVVDKNPMKQGHFMPGMALPIHAPGALYEAEITHCLILPWNIAPEIRRQEAAFTQAGGRFFTPFECIDGWF